MDFKDKNRIFSQDPNLSSGYCLRRYEVGMGYKDIFEIYKANKDAICKDKNPSALPFPIPLSVNQSHQRYMLLTRSKSAIALIEQIATDILKTKEKLLCT